MADRIEFEEHPEGEVEIEEKKDDEYEKVCLMCRRPESVAGKMIELPNNIFVCSDCMQKSFDAMNNMPLDLNQLSNTPGIHFMNLSDLENVIPKKQKIKNVLKVGLINS